VKKMPYVTSFERIGIKKGIQQGLQQGLLKEGREMILEALNERFRDIPSFVSMAVNQIEDRDVLKLVHRCAIRCASLEEFKQVLTEQS
ncbi:MAG: transposase, partial [bacterium]|nr:transposase [bacterium]